MINIELTSFQEAKAQAFDYEFQMPVCALGNTGKYIIGFDSMGKTNLIKKIAKDLIQEFSLFKTEVIICPEAKAIPIAQEMASILGVDYFVLRKAKKAYMKSPQCLEVKSITTEGVQHLWYDLDEVESQCKGKRVVLFDDVISTGASMRALEVFAESFGLNVEHKCAVFSEGDSKERDDIEVLGYLPILSKEYLENRFEVELD